MVRKLLSVLVALACAAALAGAQDLEATLRKLSEDAGSAYVAPVVSAFGADLNGGWFHESPRPVWLGFDIEVGAVMMGAMFGDQSKTFSASGTFRLNRDQAGQLLTASGFSGSAAQRDSAITALISRDVTLSIFGPTVVGSKSDSVKLGFSAGSYNGIPLVAQNLALPVVGLLDDATIFPLVAPQVTVGTVLGSMATIRYYPGQTVKKIGKVNYFGLGIQHNPVLWIPPLRKLPVNISMYFTTQTLSVGTLLKCKTSSAGLQASKRLGFYLLNLTPYLGIGYETSSIAVAYQYQLDNPAIPTATSLQDVRFTLKGENKTRATVGLNVKLLIVNINADYNFGKYNSFTAGAMVKF